MVNEGSQDRSAEVPLAEAGSAERRIDVANRTHRNGTAATVGSDRPMLWIFGPTVVPRRNSGSPTLCGGDGWRRRRLGFACCYFEIVDVPVRKLRAAKQLEK